MARTYSTMQPLGTIAPNFDLPNTNTDYGGDQVKLSDFVTSGALLIAFICNHCPYVIHIRQAFSDFAREYQSKGLAVVAISSNDADYLEEDGPAFMTQQSIQYSESFPYLFDESQSVAKAYQAACTPDFFLYDVNKKLVYRGQFDSSRPNNDMSITGADMRQAVDATLSGGVVLVDQIASVGCNIKWK